jgi:hypothetical protein
MQFLNLAMIFMRTIHTRRSAGENPVGGHS